MTGTTPCRGDDAACAEWAAVCFSAWSRFSLTAKTFYPQQSSRSDTKCPGSSQPHGSPGPALALVGPGSGLQDRVPCWCSCQPSALLRRHLPEAFGLYLHRLQEKAADTIEALQKAGIKVWVLTGDKMETAAATCYACKLFRRNTQLLELTTKKMEEQSLHDVLFELSKTVLRHSGSLTRDPLSRWAPPLGAEHPGSAFSPDSHRGTDGRIRAGGGARRCCSCRAVCTDRASHVLINPLLPWSLDTRVCVLL